MTDRERIRALCWEIEQRIGDALNREDPRVLDCVTHLVHEVAEIAKRLGMRHGPIRTRLVDGRVWVDHSTPEHGTAGGFVARKHAEWNWVAGDEQWQKVQDSMRQWVRWVDAGFELRTGYFTKPIIESEMQRGTQKPTSAVGGPDRTANSQDGICWHDTICEPPADIGHGPLTGTKGQLLRWILPQAKDIRTLDRQLKIGIYWGRQQGRYQFSIWFPTQQKFAEANRRRMEDQQNG